MAEGKRVYPAQDIVVFDDAIGIHRRLFAGQPIPPDLVGPYQKAMSAPAEADAPATEAKANWASKTPDDLKAEAAARGLEVKGTGANDNVIKTDLVAALTEDDDEIKELQAEVDRRQLTVDGTGPEGSVLKADLIAALEAAAA